jgi:hypothetical protein
MKKFKMFLLAGISGTILVGTALVLTTNRVEAGSTRPIVITKSCSYIAVGPCGQNGAGTWMELTGSNNSSTCTPTYCHYGEAR